MIDSINFNDSRNHSPRKYEGEYKNDWEWNGTQYDKNGNINFNVENGKDIKQ